MSMVMYKLADQIGDRIENSLYQSVSKAFSYIDYDLLYSLFFNNDLTHYQRMLEIEYLEKRL
jgi:hypothetical protein